MSSITEKVAQYADLAIEPKPGALYDTLVAGFILGFRSESEKSIRARVREIPEEELPKTRTGPNGGKIMYMGRNLIRYMERRTTGGGDGEP